MRNLALTLIAAATLLTLTFYGPALVNGLFAPDDMVGIELLPVEGD